MTKFCKRTANYPKLKLSPAICWYFFINVQQIFITSPITVISKKKYKENAKRNPAVQLNKLIPKILILEQVQ